MVCSTCWPSVREVTSYGSTGSSSSAQLQVTLV